MYVHQIKGPVHVREGADFLSVVLFLLRSESMCLMIMSLSINLFDYHSTSVFPQFHTYNTDYKLKHIFLLKWHILLSWPYMTEFRSNITQRPFNIVKISCALSRSVDRCCCFIFVTVYHRKFFCCNITAPWNYSFHRKSANRNKPPDSSDALWKIFIF